MKETVMYRCQKCGDLFDSELKAKYHEEEHLKAIKVKGEYYLVGYHHLRIPDRVAITFVDQFGRENTADYELTYFGPLSFFQKIGNAFAGLFRKEKFYRSETIDVE